MNSVRYGKSIPIELRIGSEGKYANFWMKHITIKSVSYTHLTLPTTPYV